MSIKKLLTTISAVFALGYGLIALPYSAVTASAAISPRLQLRQNSYVYSISGKRKGKIVLKRGTYLRALSKNAIKGKKYYRIGKGRYIRTNNAVIVPNETKDKGPVLFSVYLKYDAELYTKPNGDNSLYTLIGKQNVYETYTYSDAIYGTDLSIITGLRPVTHRSQNQKKMKIYQHLTTRMILLTIRVLKKKRIKIIRFHQVPHLIRLLSKIQVSTLNH